MSHSSASSSSPLVPCLVIAGSVLGISALCWRGISWSRQASSKTISETYSSSRPRSVTSSQALSPVLRQRVAQTYGYVLGGVGATAVAATVAYRLGAAEALVNASNYGIAARIGIAVGVALPAIGSFIAMKAIPRKRKVARHVAWLSFFAPLGVSMSVVGLFSPVIVGQAALVSGAVIGSLSTVALCSPSRRFLSWGGAITAGLAGIFAISVGQLIWPHSMVLRGLHLYGGLLFFCGSLLYSSSKFIAAAEAAPVLDNADDEDEAVQRAVLSGNPEQAPYDPMTMSLDVYLDSLNIFVRILEIMAGGRNKQ